MGNDSPSEGDEGFPAGSASGSGSNCWPVTMRPGIAFLRSRVFVASVAPGGLVHIPNALPDPRRTSSVRVADTGVCEEWLNR